MNLKIADFGFACYKNIYNLQSYRGTMTYMAPEIKEGRQYDGTQVDIFSMGVILFIMAVGIFPFMEARNSDYFYNLLLTGQTDIYWQKVQGTNLSAEFRDLMEKMFSHDANRRPTLDEIRDHPWMNSADTMPFEQVRREIMMEVASKK
mmetsp:Transcript_62321/g.86079  ORF Transcript_62321/g.86079 Transcript_62321/m.86079 type:complete len:148 (+) Transcript_62321:534-977(+)